MQRLQVSDRRRSGFRKDPVGARERAREQQLTEWTRCKKNLKNGKYATVQTQRMLRKAKKYHIYIVNYLR